MRRESREDVASPLQLEIQGKANELPKLLLGDHALGCSCWQPNQIR